MGGPIGNRDSDSELQKGVQKGESMRLDLGVQTRWEMASSAPFFVCVCVRRPQDVLDDFKHTCKAKGCLWRDGNSEALSLLGRDCRSRAGGPSGSPGVRGLSKEAWF